MPGLLDALTPFDAMATLGLDDTVALDQMDTDITAWAPSVRIVTWGEWMDEGARHFGPDRGKWVFRCLGCGREQGAMDFVRQGIDPTGKVFMSCLGRFLPPSDDPWLQRHCRFTLGDAFRFPKVVVLFGEHEVPVFEYAIPRPQRLL